MLLPVFLLNQTLLYQQNFPANYLQEPTLVFHDGLSQDIINSIARVQSKPVVLCTADARHSRWDLKIRVRSVILVANSPDSLIPHLRGWQIWSARDRLIAVVESEEVVQDWLKILWEKIRAVNVVIMVTTSPPKFYTWFPYSSSDCSNVSTIFQLDKTALFPEKLSSSLNGCFLKAVTSWLPPLVDGSEGVEPQLLQNIAHKLNGTIKYVPLPPEKRVWTGFDMFGLPSNGLKLLWENEVDFIFSNLRLDYDMFLFAEPIYSHLQDEFVFFVPAPLLASKITALLLVFPAVTWLIVLVTLMILCTANGVINYVLLGRLKLLLLPSLAISLNLPVHSSAFIAHRVLTLFAYIFGLHITTAYQASLIYFLSHSIRQDAIKTFEDLANSEYPVAFHDSFETLIRYHESPYIKAIVSAGRCRFKPIFQLDLIASREEVVLGPKLSFVLGIPEHGEDHGVPKILVVKPALFTIALVFYVSLGHPLAPIMNQYNLWMFEAGLPQHYLRKYDQNHGIIQPTNEPFRVENVIAAFYILGIFLALATVFFVIEVLVQWKILLKRPNQLLFRNLQRPFCFGRQ